MEFAVNILEFELQDAIAAGASEEYITGIRQAIMVLNKNLFHQKIMGSDPNNQYYATKV